MISKHPRVLYAENDKDACFLLATTLKFSDIEVTTVGTAAEACKLGQTEHFDLYLLDSWFSDGSGLDLCRCLHKNTPQTPILFYSGHAYADDVKDGLEAGADAYLVKPYFDTFVDKILQMVEPLKRQVALN